MVGRVRMCVGGAVDAAEVAVVARWGRAVRQSVTASLALETSTVGWPACVIIVVSSAAHLYIQYIYSPATNGPDLLRLVSLPPHSLNIQLYIINNKTQVEFK